MKRRIVNKKNLVKIASIILVLGALFFASTNRSITSAGVINSPYPKKDKVGDSILVVGSTAMQILSEYAADDFQKQNSGVTVTVQGGGSGAGLTQIQAGSVQIGNSDVFAEEKSGIDASKLVDHKAAVAAFAPVVNTDVTIDNLTSDQLHDIFTGKITNWKEVGGPDKTITVINRAGGSGSRMVFESNVLKKGEKPVKAQEQDSNGTVRKIVSSTPGAISYLGFGEIYGKNIKALNLDGLKPETSNVVNNQWKIWSYEHMYTKGNPRGTTKAFITYFLSADFQERVLPKLGYVPIEQMQVEKNYKGEVVPR